MAGVLCLAALALVLLEFTPLPYPPFEASSLALLALLAVVAHRYSPASVPFASTLLLAYPLLVPAITTHVYGVAYYTPFAAEFQSRALANKIVFLGTLLCVLSVVLLAILERDTGANLRARLAQFDRSIPVDGYGLLALAALSVGGAYLLAPGPTVFHLVYGEQAAQQAPWATFAGALYKGAWAVLFALTARHSLRSRQFGLLVLVTVLGAGWLGLHGRRIESAGMVVLVFGVAIWHHLDLRVRDLPRHRHGLLLGAAFVGYGVFLVVVGRVRNLLATSSGGSVISEAAGSLQYGPETVGLPGGAHGTYGTIQATVGLFDAGRPLLLGETFLNYVPRTVPTGLWRLVGLSPPEGYRSLLAATYDWNGGNYLLNPYYANAGVLSVLLAAVVVALVLLVMRAYLRGQVPAPTLLTVVAAVLFVNLFRAYWYAQLNWIDTLQGAMLAGAVYYLVYRTRRALAAHRGEVTG